MWTLKVKKEAIAIVEIFLDPELNKKTRAEIFALSPNSGHLLAA